MVPSSITREMVRACIAVASLTAFASLACFAQQSGVKASKVVRLRGNVLAVEDSDRLKIAADDGNVYSAVLIGVDAPDERQNYFKKARKRLSDLVDGKDVTVMLWTDEKGGTFAVVFAGAEDVGLRLIQDGLAWFSPGRSFAQNSADREKYQQAQAAARSAKNGLWDDKDPIAPWAFRGEKSELPVETDVAAQPVNSSPKSVPVPGRTYILGPRGGCYYLNEQGIKIYVKDKTLCQKPQ
jgi:endonuclease YncB( thermonuclease family)